MNARLRAELKATTEWKRHTRIFRTQTEKDAIVIRDMRHREIIQWLKEIASRN